jgi:hypothetical protein
MQSKDTRSLVDRYACDRGLPEIRKAAPGGGQRPHLFGSPTVTEFYDAVARSRAARLLLASVPGSLKREESARLIELAKRADAPPAKDRAAACCLRLAKTWWTQAATLRGAYP